VLGLYSTVHSSIKFKFGTVSKKQARRQLTEALLI